MDCFVDRDVLPFVSEISLDDANPVVISQMGESFNVLSLNIRSMKLNYDQFLAYIENIICKIDIIVLCEVNIKDYERQRFLLKHFKMHTNLRSCKRGGGVIIFVREKIDFVVARSVNNSYEGIHGVFTLNGYKTNLVAIYRPPGNNNPNYFIDELNELLCSLDNKQQVLITGDMNLDLNDATNIHVNSYKNVMARNGLRRCIFRATRVEMTTTGESSSCIDHFYARVKNVGDKIHSVVFETKISDHYIVMTGIRNNKQKSARVHGLVKTEKIIIDERVRSLGLKNIDWGNFNEIRNPAEFYNAICNKFSIVHKSSEKIILTNTDTLSRNCKPWVTADIKRQMKTRDKLYKKWKTSTKIEHRKAYNSCRNDIIQKLQKSKKSYYKKCFNDCLNDRAAIWKVINEVIGKVPSSSPDEIISKHMANIYEPGTIVDHFVEYFHDGVQNVSHNCSIITSPRVPMVAMQSMLLRKATVRSINEIIMQLNPKKGPGLDAIRTKDILQISKNISPVLTKFINLIIESGEIPDALKHSIVRPIYKAGDHKEFNNYRPIAILPVIEKIFERFIANQLISYLNEFNIIDKRQYGFQKKKSTGMLLADFSDKVYGALNKNLYAVVIFIDFSKAFDTLLHDRLLTSLENIGIRGPVLSLFKNYLSNRYMTVKYLNRFSKSKKCQTGVPQGSIMGPILYLIYVNEMLSKIVNCDIFLYADDTALLAIHKNFNSANEMIQNDFNRLLKWSHDSGLSINYKKTKVMTIQSPSKFEKRTADITFHNYACLHLNSTALPSLPISKCHCTLKIENTFSHTYLGLLIDSQFKWDKHIDGLCSKLRSSLYSIRLLKSYVNFNTIRTVYFALIESHIRYGLLSWGRTSLTYLNKINKILDQCTNTIEPLDHANANDRNELLFMNIQQLHFNLYTLTNFFEKKTQN